MFRFSFRFTFHHLQPQRLALHSKNASTRQFSDSPSSHKNSTTISIKHVATSSEIPPRKIIAPPFNTAIVKQVADKVRKLRSAIINSNNTNSNIVASSSSSSIAANTTPQQLHHQNVQREQDYLRSCLDYFARNPSEFIEWCSNASIAALAHVVQGAEMAKVNPKTGRFVNQALIPALWYRFFGTNSPASSSSSSTRSLSSSSSKSKNESQENLEKLSNIFRRLCDMRIYNFENFSSDESEKRDNSVPANQNIDSPLLTDTQNQKSDVLKYLAEKIVCGIAGGVHFAEEEGNQAGKDSVMLTIKSINNVLPAIGEVLATFQGKNANENDNFRFLLTIANKLLKSADNSLLVLSLQPNPESTTDGASVCLLSTHDVFHLVRILRFAASHLVFLRQNQLHQQQCDLLDVEASQAFFATCLNIIVDVPHHHRLRRNSQLYQNQQNFSRLRGSHLVTVLQSCAKVLSAVRERNFGTAVDGEDVDVDADKKQGESHPINSSYFYDNLLQVSNIVVKKFDTLANDYFYQQSNHNNNNHGNNLSKSSSTLSLKVFDTSPAAVAKAAFSIEIILQHLRRKNIENNNNVSKSVNTCVFAVLSADLHNMNAALFSLVAWCEFLSAIRLRNRSKNSAHNKNNPYNDGGDVDDDNVTNKLMSLVEANFMQIFRLALTSTLSNDDGVTVKHTESLSSNTSSSLSAAQLLLSVSYECHITNLDPLVIIECCQLIKNEKLSNNKFSNVSFLLLNKDLTKLAVRVALRQLSSTTLTASSEHPDAITTSLEQMRKELIALCSSSSSLSSSACLEQGNDEIISPMVCSTSIDTIRNLIALGATLTDCEDLIVIALTPTTASTTNNAGILPALSWFISTKQLVQFARTVCFCKLINLSTAPSVDATAGKSNSKNSDSLVQKLLLERCELLVTIFSGSFLTGQKKKEKENHHRKIFSTVGECFVRAGIGPSSLLAEALASSFLSSSKDGTANFLIDSFKRFHDDDKIDEMKQGDAASRNLNEEFLFLCMCSEHVLFAPVQQHVFFPSNEETGINSVQMDLFDWVASKVAIIHLSFQHEMNDNDERIERENIANEMRRHFENVLWNINVNRLHNVVTAQLPFALSSKKLSSQGEDNFVRGRVMQKLLSSMVEEGKSKKIGESYHDSNPVEHERIPAASTSAWPNWKRDNFDNSL